MWYVYILELANKRRYTGSTKDIDKRIVEHEKGEVKATKYNRPIKLLYVREFGSEKKARQVEYRLKKQKSKRILKMFVDESLNLPEFDG